VHLPKCTFQSIVTPIKSTLALIFLAWFEACLVLKLAWFQSLWLSFFSSTQCTGILMLV